MAPAITPHLKDEGYAVMELDADTANLLKGVYFQLAYMDVEDDILLYLGRDNDIDMDWETESSLTISAASGAPLTAISATWRSSMRATITISTAFP